MEHNDAKAIIENILFVADTPLPVDKITPVFSGDLSREDVIGILGELAADYQDRALMVAEVAEGWRIQTRPEYATWITAFFKMEKGQKLSRASLEVLAIVAYRQPITRTEMDEIRGVDCGGVLRGLIDKGLVKTMGRRRAPGKPMMYGTTSKFLEFFGLARLSDLPTLEEFRAELGEDRLGQNQPGLPFEGEEGEEAASSAEEENALESGESAQEEEQTEEPNEPMDENEDSAPEEQIDEEESDEEEMSGGQEDDESGAPERADQQEGEDEEAGR
ncbi:MAG: SMC-Scp complex subunit ScpB [Nitrospinota bacterium]|nr:SMC-Scp complex subunit ScpB [Nitrospinota bacterium]